MEVGGSSPWKSPTHRDKHPQAGLVLEQTQEALGFLGDPLSTSSPAFLLGHSKFGVCCSHKLGGTAFD